MYIVYLVCFFPRLFRECFSFLQFDVRNSPELQWLLLEPGFIGETSPEAVSSDCSPMVSPDDHDGATTSAMVTYGSPSGSP